MRTCQYLLVVKCPLHQLNPSKDVVKIPVTVITQREDEEPTEGRNGGSLEDRHGCRFVREDSGSVLG
jgi:hypothetical protein